MKPVFMVLSIWLFVAQSTFAAPQAANQRAASPKATEQVFVFFKKAKDDLDACHMKYATYLLDIETAKLRKEAEILEAAVASGATSRPNTKISTAEVIGDIEPVHKSCIDNAKNARLSESAKALAGIKKVRTKDLAKDTLAQWITAIDSIGVSNGMAEWDKFKNLLNRLIVELAE